jgi:DNA-directed RNA polymerase subunit beta'
MSTLLPKSTKKSLEYINNTQDKKALNKLLSQIYLEYGAAKTAFLANTLKNLGFRYATKAGTTISIADLDIPKVKKELIKNAEDQIDKATSRYLKGDITEVERYTKVIDTWSETTEKLTQSVVDNFDRLNPVYMMAFSGARGNLSQVSQLVGMRGLMADAQGQIIDLPIKSNFKEGLSVTEYIISSYGARKGLVDTALKTADSGYLTRRLVDVAQDVIIRKHDCGTTKGVVMSDILLGDKVMVTLEDRLLGRTTAKDVIDADGTVIMPENTLMNRIDVTKIKDSGVKHVTVRSPLSCELEYGICQRCYGWALTNNKPVDIGESIGIIAAQSIGEPGTQLTMRTFHTGGVFRGTSSAQYIKATVGGKVVSRVNTRELRTRHGDLVEVSVKDGKIEIEDKKGKVHSYKIPYGATVFPVIGTEVKAGDVISEFEPGSARGESSRLTEKATKDITANLSGKVNFDGFSVDEKRDRQGNISRIANKNGTVWVLSGDVYNLPGGSKIKVKDQQDVVQETVLAETITVSEHGGEVRISEELEVQEIKVDGKKIKKIVNGKEITIVIASILPKNATLETTKKEQLWKVDKTNETYVIKSPVGSIVENGMIVAELLDEEYSVSSSGEIRYAGIEVDEHHIITTPGKVVFIPEEIHQINKDATLKMVESGTYVTAGTEIVKDVRCHIDGVVDIKEYNDIIHEVVIRPGELHKIDDISSLKVEEGEIIEEGSEIAPGIIAKTKCIITVLTTASFGISDFALEEDIDEDFEETKEPSSEKVDILLRPVQEFDITPKEVSIKFTSTEDELIDIAPVTQLQYRDGSRIRQLEGASLTRTSLVLQMHGYLGHLKGMVELEPKDAPIEEQNLKIVVLENIIVRKDVDDSTRGKSSLQTELLVKDGQSIEPKTPVSKTQVLARNDGKISFNQDSEGEIRRLLLISSDLETVIQLKTKPVVKVGDLIRIDQVLSESGEIAKLSGQITKIKANEITIRGGRPYLISAGTQLQTENGSLVQRGDLLATLVFERQKTGDIVQGLPRVEELLEGRKPKESAILAEETGEAELEYDEDIERLFLVSETGRQEIKVPVDANIIVNDKQKIIQGQPLTDGPLNPHDVIRLSGVAAVQKYLVDEVQRVYRSQGVEIADKHIETIVRQMTKKVKVDDSGDTKLLPGELVELYQLEIENAESVKIGGTGASYHNVLLGITKASLNTESFISAASFQETTRVLTEAAVEGKKDQLRGLKENVIIGRLIPAGTGFYHLEHASELREEEEKQQRLNRSNVRKPSAILEEIEGMFGSPDFTIE